jgi:hypothetical protein
MAELQTSITRDIEFLDTKDGKYYFRISEGGKEIFQSDLYEDQRECCDLGMAMMDHFHETMPLRSQYIPANGEYGVKYSG